MCVREPLNFGKSCSEKILSALAIRSRIMVECRRDLDQSLQKYFFRIERLQPDFLPMFMGLVEMPGVEGFESFAKKSIFVVRFHELCARERASGKVHGIIANSGALHRRRRLATK